MKTINDALRMVAGHEAEARSALRGAALNVKVVVPALRLASEHYRKASECCALVADALEETEEPQ